MRGIEPLQHFGFVMRDVDARNSMRENVAADSDSAQRGKLFEWKFHYLSSNIQRSVNDQAPNTRPATVILRGAKNPAPVPWKTLEILTQTNNWCWMFRFTQHARIGNRKSRSAM